MADASKIFKTIIGGQGTEAQNNVVCANAGLAKIGSEAFLEPDIFICPLSVLAPKTSNFCMIKL